jgi:MFS family permease
VDLSPLRHSRDFRLLYFGQLVSMFGSAVSYVVLPWQMYQLTRSPVAVGMLGLAEFVPMLSVALLGGALADAFDRRRLILCSEAGMALCCAALIANSAAASPSPWLLYVVAAAFAALNAVHRPAMEALLPHFADRDKMPAVGALRMLSGSFGHITGPALAGLLVAAAGPLVAYTIDLATYLASMATLLLVRSVPVPPEADRPSLSGMVDALRYARSRQELIGTYLVDINAMFFGMPIALFPAIAHEKFGDWSVGLLYAAQSVGVLLMTVSSRWTGRVERHGLAVLLAATVWGVAIIGFGLADHLWLALLCLAVAGAADGVSAIFRMTIWNQTIPDHIRGRMAGIEMISYTTGPYLGNAEAGLVAGWLGVRVSVVSGGVLCVLGCAALAAALPRFVAYRRASR